MNESENETKRNETSETIVERIVIALAPDDGDHSGKLFRLLHADGRARGDAKEDLVGAIIRAICWHRREIRFLVISGQPATCLAAFTALGAN